VRHVKGDLADFDHAFAAQADHEEKVIPKIWQIQEYQIRIDFSK
jgi:hypothetical protein